jgi:hypothetical protein
MCKYTHKLYVYYRQTQHIVCTNDGNRSLRNKHISYLPTVHIPWKKKKLLIKKKLFTYYYYFFNLIFLNVCNQYLPELQYKAKSKCDVEFVFFACYRSIRVLYIVLHLFLVNLVFESFLSWQVGWGNWTIFYQKLKLNMSTHFHDVKR